MASTEIYDRLEALFRRTTVLPRLPGSALRLLEKVEEDDPWDPILEKVVMSDPALTASIMRIASSVL